MGYLSLQHLQLYSTLVDIVSGVFGKKKPNVVTDKGLPPERAVAEINRMLAGG